MRLALIACDSLIPGGIRPERTDRRLDSLSAGAPAKILHHAVMHQAAPDRLIMIRGSDPEDGIEKTVRSHIREQKTTGAAVGQRRGSAVHNRVQQDRRWREPAGGVP